MPTPITPVAQHSGVAINRPIPGEKVAMETGPSPLAPLFQAIMDRCELSALSLLGEMRGGEIFHVLPGGLANSAFMTLNPIDRVVLKDSSGVTWITNVGGTPALPVAFSNADFAGAVLPSNAWIYAYVSVSTAALLTRELSTTAPDDSGVWKDGAVGTHRFVGCFRTGSAGAPLPGTSVRGRWVYLRSAMATGNFAANGLEAVNAGLTAYTSLDLSARVPPHARRVLLFGQANIISVGTGIGALNLYDGSATTSIAEVIEAVCNTNTENAQNSSTAEIELDTQAIGYSITQSAGTAAGVIRVVGWE